MSKWIWVPYFPIITITYLFKWRMYLTSCSCVTFLFYFLYFPYVLFFKYCFTDKQKEEERKERIGMKNITGHGCDGWEYWFFWKIQLLQIIQVMKTLYFSQKRRNSLIVYFSLVFFSHLKYTWNVQMNNKASRGRHYTHFNNDFRNAKN